MSNNVYNESNTHKRGVNGHKCRTYNHSSNGSNSTAVKQDREPGNIDWHEILDASAKEILAVRLVAFVIWTGAIVYATYHVFLACEIHLEEWYRDPIMNPSAFSSIFNRGKDATDHEWEMFSSLYSSRLWFWYGLYAIMARIIQPAFADKWKFISLGLSVVMFWELIGFLPTTFLLLQPAIYWGIAQTRRKLWVWTVTVIFIYNLNAPVIQTFIPNNTFAEYFFVIASAWNCCRCISFCHDVWDKTGSGKIGLIYLENVLRFCFYLPLAISGPLVTYHNFEESIINKDIDALKKRDLTSDFLKLLKTVARLGLIAFLTEFVLHFLYFRALSYSYSIHRHLNLWAVCGTIYWLGQFFSMKYKVLYGFPSCIAEFDGMEMPPLPRCPSYIHRYSALWRDFDRGLYRFLVNYIYLPTLTWVKGLDKNNQVPVDIFKLAASFMTFVYVYIWHSLSFDVFVWTALNFLGITIERIGSIIKREVDKRMRVEPIQWDFIIEPIVTVPLAAMSILNSSIFCGNLDAAWSFTSILWKRRADNWVFLFLYCLTHTAVAHRTWRNKFQQLFSKVSQS